MVSCLKNKSLKTTLRVATGTPLLTGIIIIVAVSISLIELNAVKWMLPVVESLEKEETSSLQRLAIAQAGFAEEIMGQMFDEANLAQDFATKILSKDFVATQNALPSDAYQYTLPLSSYSVGKLEYDKYKIETYPPPLANVCSKINNAAQLKNCWFDPEIPLTAGRVVEGAGQTTSAEKLTVSLKTTGLYWPHPKATGALGPYMPNCEGDKYSECVLDPSYEFKDINNLNQSLVEEIELTSYISDTFLQTFLSNEAIEFMYIGTHGHGVFRSFPYGHSIGRVTKDRKSARDGKIRIGYDPRHRPWYWQCEQAGKTIVTPPYVDATTDELVITVSTPVYDKSTNKLLAVIGYDVSIARLAELILSSKVLEHGYAYLVTAKQGYTYAQYGIANQDDAGKLVVYPGLSASDIDNGNTDLLQWENLNSDEKFKQGVYKDMLDPLGVPALATYKKNKELWHIAYANVKTPKYALAFVVPDTDIRMPAVEVENLIQNIVESQTILFVCFILLAFAIFIWMQIEVAHFVVQPIKSLTRVIDLIIKDIARSQADARGQDDVKLEENSRKKRVQDKTGKFQLHVNDLIKPEDEGCKEVSMMKDSFEHMLMALRFGSDSAAKNDLRSALKIYDEARIMFKSLSNMRGEGIATFNLAVIYHKIWLQSDKMDMQAFSNAENYYKLSIDNGNEVWNTLLANNGVAPYDSHVVPINRHGVEMTQQRGGAMAVAPIITDDVGDEIRHQSSDGSSIDENAQVKIPKRLIGNDMADKLAARLHHYSQLLVDTAQLKHYNAAKIMLEQALMLDTNTNNLLGYSARVGLYGEVLFGLGHYQVAEEKVMGQLNILRNRVATFEHTQESLETQNLSTKEIQRTQSAHQEEEELFQAYQNGLLDAASMMANDPKKRHDMEALKLFKEALTCSRRTKKHTIGQIFLRMEPVVNRNFDKLPEKFNQSFKKELNAFKGSGTGIPKDVAFVVDYSGSMAGGKIRRAREGVTSVIRKHLNDGVDRGAIIKFNSSVETLCKLTESKARMYQIVEKLRRPNMATALWDALGAAIQTLQKDSIQNSERDPWIVCVSDGEDNKSRSFQPTKISSLIKKHRVNVIILSVGVTDKQALQDMRHVAESNASGCVGEFIEIHDSSEIDEAFATIGTLVGGGLEVQHY